MQYIYILTNFMKKKPIKIYIKIDNFNNLYEIFIKVPKKKRESQGITVLLGQRE